MRNVEFVPPAFKEYQEWIEIDRKVALRIGDLVRDILRILMKVLGNQKHLSTNLKDIGAEELIMSIG